jgi:hypothetical protein
MHCTPTLAFPIALFFALTNNLNGALSRDYFLIRKIPTIAPIRSYKRKDLGLALESCAGLVVTSSSQEATLYAWNSSICVG